MDMTSEIERQHRKNRRQNSYKKTGVHRLRLIVNGESFVLGLQDNNEYNKHTVEVMNDGCTVRHVTQSILQVSG